MIDIYATREEEDDSNECEVPHEQSKGVKSRVRMILFLLCSTLFVGFRNDEIGCPYFQAFATNLPFGPLDGNT